MNKSAAPQKVSEFSLEDRKKYPKRVIALYMIAGFGHLKPALALLEQMKKCKIETEAWDIFADDTKETPLDNDSFYNRISTTPTFIKVWNKYSGSNSLSRFFAKPFHWYDWMTNSALTVRVKKAYYENPNTVFFCTHFTPANLVSKALPYIKTFVYITDLHPHPIWAIKRANLIYLVPVEYTKEVLMKYGIPPQNIRVVSFPINPLLIEDNDKRFEQRIKHLTAEKTTDILILSGGAGTGLHQMQSLLRIFAAPAHAHKVRVTFLASTLKLREALKETRVEVGLPKDSVSIETYKPDTLYPAMRKAEVLITKAGGDITLEALAEGLPVYTLEDVGDHERINRKYMEEIGASRQLTSDVYPWELIHHDLLTGKIIEMAKASHNAGEFHRAAGIPKLLFQEMGWE